jgi:hypothetical protein
MYLNMNMYVSIHVRKYVFFNIYICAYEDTFMNVHVQWLGIGAMGSKPLGHISIRNWYFQEFENKYLCAYLYIYIYICLYVYTHIVAGDRGYGVKTLRT